MTTLVEAEAGVAELAMRPARSDATRLLPSHLFTPCDLDLSKAVETSAEDRAKIDKYLEEGDRLYASGDYQQAIDTWSRVFLIDVTNDDASERTLANRKRLAALHRPPHLHNCLRST